MRKLVNPQIVLKLIQSKFECKNLTLFVEDKTNLVLDLDGEYIYFEIEVIKSFYRLTKHTFSNTLQKLSEVNVNFDYIAQVNEYIINASLRANKIKGIPCKRK